VEPSGQCFNRILESCILDAKPHMVFEGTDGYHVWLTLEGKVQGPRFLRLMEAVGQEQARSFDTNHLLVLDLAHRQWPIPVDLRSSVHLLVGAGALDGTGRRVISSRRLMAKGTKRRGALPGLRP